MERRRVLIGVSGASGAPLAVDLLRRFRSVPDVETHLICSPCGALTVEHETELSLQEMMDLADCVYDNNALGAGPASGSFQTMGMVVVPCSMKTLAGIVSGYSDSLLLRAADVTLKERRRLILVPRECPFSTLHLRNLTAASELGAVIVPPVPAYYNRPQTIEDVNRQISGKVMDLLGIDVQLNPEWKGLSE
jgi:polyprenyl P-hydroxybenzoate/phenylacrylic acid decarboxylase-like protein